MNSKTLMKRLASLEKWKSGCRIRRNSRDGGTTKTAARMRQKIKQNLSRRLRRLGVAFIVDQEDGI